MVRTSTNVGNRAGTFPSQLLGWDVDAVNTVQFSNHTGYGRWGGLRFDAAHLADVFANMKKNGLLRHNRILTGTLRTLIQAIRRRPKRLLQLRT